MTKIYLSQSTFYSVRTVKALDRDEAVEKVRNGEFDEQNSICDKVLLRHELINQLGVKNWESR
jgi:hypothetical protein